MNCREGKFTWDGRAIGEATALQLHDISFALLMIGPNGDSEIEVRDSS
jgi:hypothetical protein